MVDIVSPEVRSRIMSRIRGKDTKPERIVRSFLHRMGFRFRLHRRDLPGNPDIVLPKYRSVVFVHGCFWHRHQCANNRPPKSRVQFWQQKLNDNQQRDQRNQKELQDAGWHVHIVWECELDSPKRLEDLIREIGRGGVYSSSPEADQDDESG